MSQRPTIGLDAGGTKLLAGVVDDGHEVTFREHALWRGSDSETVIGQILGAVDAALQHAPDAAAVGLGLPALVDADGRAHSSVHLPLDGVDLGQLVRERTGLPVHVDNDANAALLCEHRLGAARGASHAVMLTIGTGIGGGLLLGGALYRGAAGFGAELGHIVVDLGGAPCFGDCPGRGCLEAVASGSALARTGLAAARRLPDSALGGVLSEHGLITGVDVTEAALAGDAVAVEVVTHAARRLGAGLVSIVNALNPELVVVGGGVLALGELMRGPAREVMTVRALAPSAAAARVVAAEFGEDAGMIGAALLAVEEAR